ncbi:hypothetical protein [Streptomyces sp. NPDC094472]|uniref:hypothetical protein n=1 Tax=Streptomyces sp. NPDC094472 TaxID=3155080 RepID=UPI0033242B59
MSDMETRLWALIEGKEERLPLLTLGEAQATVELLQLLSSGDGEGSDVAYDLAGKLARRLPAKD